MSNDANPNEKLKKYLDIYLSPSESRTSTVDELEVRFGTEKPITQIQFDDVIAKLKSVGFSLENMAGLYRLTIQSEYTDPKSGYTKISSIRTELSGLANIQEYCKKNTIDLDANSRIVQDAIFVQKNRKSVNGTTLQSIDFDDFGFRVNYKTESKRNRRSNVIGKMISEWNESKKIFRLIKRFTFMHENYPLKIDCSIVRSSKKNRSRLIPEYRIETSNVFNNPESYEIEVELMTHDFPVSMGTHVSDPEFSDTSNVLKLLKRTIKSVLSGLQNSNFPISSKVEQSVIRNYMNMLHKGNPPSRWVGSRDFVGFSSISLEIPNISAVNEESGVANIRNSYTVTEKADGIR